MSNDRVMIVGAGVGGLTAAVALKRAGREIAVFERAPQLLELGAGFAIQSNAVTALRQIGLGEEFEANGAVLENFAHRTWSGKLLASWPTGNIAQNLGAPILGVSRPNVQHILSQALDPGDFRFGHELTELDQDDSGVTVRFANGAEERGAMLIGADGSNSTVRTRFDETRRRYSGYTTWLALSNLASPEPDTHTQWYGEHSIFGAHAVGGGKTYWYASKTAPEGEHEEDTKRNLLALFGDWHEVVPAFIEATDQIPRSDIYDLDRRDAWGSGRVTLVGDAAHPMVPALGQGACQAIEDGVVLARCVSADGDPVSALRTYEAKRIARTAPIVKRARAQGKLMQGDNTVMRLARDLSFRLAPTGQVLKSFQKVLTYPDA